MKAALGLFLVLTAVLSATARQRQATIIYDDAATQVASAREEAADRLSASLRSASLHSADRLPADLWITTADLKRATRFEVKPQGVCRDELCFPLPKAKRQAFLRKESGTTWFNLTAFAALVRQPVAHDEATSTWYFGLRSDQRQALSSLQAPDFTLPDINGKRHSLSDFRGKKVLLVTWASW